MSLPAVFRKVCEKNRWPFDGKQAEVTVEGGRKQSVVLQPFQHESDPMVRAYTVIGKGGGASTPDRLQSALRLNFSLPHGAVALHQGELVMTDTFLLKDAGEDEVESSIRFIASIADRYEKAMFGTDRH